MQGNIRTFMDGMSSEVVRSMLETLPVEITVIDSEDKVIGWNKHRNRLFKRPDACYGMDFRECHGEKNLSLVEKIVGEMKQGTRNKARFWIDAEAGNGERHKIMIEFYALRDGEGAYLGCMECTQDIESMMHLTGEKRLIDGSEEESRIRE